MKQTKLIQLTMIAGLLVLASGVASAQSLGDYARTVRKDKSEPAHATRHFDNDNLPTTDALSVVGPAPETTPTAEPATTAQNGAPQNGAPQSVPSQTAPVTKLEHALKTAISAAHNAEKFGADLGYVVRFDADAIKSMAITVLINMSEGGRR